MPYWSRISEDHLRSMAGQLIAAGHLPLMIARNVTAGDGSGEHCKLCDQPVGPQRLAYEVSDIRDGALLVFHIICHSAWQHECVRRMSNPQLPC